jgi:hypothetical protein
MERLLKVFDVVGGPTLARLIWPVITRLSPLTQSEIESASRVLGPDAIRYAAVRIGQGGLLSLAFKVNGGRAFTTFRILNLPKEGDHSRSHMPLLVHELVHVYQFERVGSRYITQALRAQRTEGYGYDGYGYDGWVGLNDARAAGKRYRDYNREQQAQIAQDYYRDVLEPDRPADDPVSQAYEPYITELRNADL